MDGENEMKFYVALGGIGCQTLMILERRLTSNSNVSFVYCDTDPCTESHIPPERFFQIPNFSKGSGEEMGLGKSALHMDHISGFESYFEIPAGEHSIDITYVTSSFGGFGAGSVLWIADFINSILKRKISEFVVIRSRIIAFSHEFFEGFFPYALFTAFQANTETLARDYFNRNPHDMKLFIVFSPQYKDNLSEILLLADSGLDEINTLSSRNNRNDICQEGENNAGCIEYHPYKGKEPYVFVSYSHKNIFDALQIIRHLQSEGYRVWYDEGIDPGTEWDENIASHIKACSIFVALLSNEYINSSNCKDELSFARDLEKKRLLIYLHDSIKMPDGMGMRTNRLQNIHKYRYSDDMTFFEKLKETDGLHDCLGKTPVQTKATQPILMPSAATTGNFGEKFFELYQLLVNYRESIRNGKVALINETTLRLQLVLQELYLMYERYQYVQKEMADAAVSIVNQYNKYVVPFNAFANASDRMTDEAQGFAKQAEEEFKKLIHMVVRYLP